MPTSTLTWYKTKTNKILKDIKRISQREIADEINESQQTISYRLKNVYPEVLEDLVRILNLADYEIVRKGD